MFWDPKQKIGCTNLSQRKSVIMKGEPTSTEQNKTLLRRIPEKIYNKGNLAVADEIVAVDYIEHLPLPPEFPSGIEGLKLLHHQLLSKRLRFRTCPMLACNGEK